VTAAAVESFRARSATVAHHAHGIPVTFRGQEVRAILSPIAIGLDLDTGGLRQGGEFRCRFLASSIASAPRRGEPVLYNGRTYLVTEVSQPANMTGEHVVTLTPGSAQ
jgi:hypothetical protein